MAYPEPHQLHLNNAIKQKNSVETKIIYISGKYLIFTLIDILLFFESWFLKCTNIKCNFLYFREAYLQHGLIKSCTEHALQMHWECECSVNDL